MAEAAEVEARESESDRKYMELQQQIFQLTELTKEQQKRHEAELRERGARHAAALAAAARARPGNGVTVWGLPHAPAPPHASQVRFTRKKPCWNCSWP